MTHSEQQIERQVERIIDDIDYRYLHGEYSDSQYSELIKSVDDWAERQYSMLEQTK